MASPWPLPAPSPEDLGVPGTRCINTANGYSFPSSLYGLYKRGYRFRATVDGVPIPMAIHADEAAGFVRYFVDESRLPLKPDPALVFDASVLSIATITGVVRLQVLCGVEDQPTEMVLGAVASSSGLL